MLRSSNSRRADRGPPALLHQAIGQRDVAADHQLAGHGVLHQVIIRRVGPLGTTTSFTQVKFG